jgi:hypothetical protein
MPLTLEFIGKVSGDSMSGENGHRPDGQLPFTGRGPDRNGEEAASLLAPSSQR